MKIKRVINGKIYNTETAELIADVGSDAGVSYTDFRWHDTGLYVTKQGAFFLAGEGGAMSMWRRPCGNGTGGGSGILPVDPNEAREWAERAELSPEEMAKYFPLEEA